MHIKQSRKMATKFMDPNPSNRVVFGTSGTGPATKNLARPNDPANELMRREIMGRTSVLNQSTGMRCPTSLTGNSAEVDTIRVNDMCARNKLKCIRAELQIMKGQSNIFI